jgi:hypothetical protein
MFVPGVVIGPDAAARALRVDPTPLAAGAFTPRGERVPDFTAARIARPRIRARRTPLARGAADPGKVLVDVVVDRKRDDAILASNESDDEGEREQREEKVYHGRAPALPDCNWSSRAR